MFNFHESPVTLILLLINVVFSGYILMGDLSLFDRFSFKPGMILKQRQYYRMFSSGFIHAGFGHLAFNMITLFSFGPELERLLGSLAFAVIYFGSELAANGLSLYRHRASTSYASVGASGAISGVLFGFSLYYPLTKLYIFFIPVGIPAALFAVLYVVLSIYAMRESKAGGMTGGIAHEAHLGGALGGLLITIMLDPEAPLIFLNQLGL